MDAELRAALPAQVCGQRFHPRALRTIRELIAASPEASRAELTEQVCVRLGWIDARGRAMRMGAATALLRFHRKGWIVLPAPRCPGRRVAVRRAVPPRESLALPEPIEASLSELGTVRLRPVEDRAASRTWNALIGHYHYCGYRPLCGVQMRYLAVSEREERVLGALGFGAAALALRDRDRYIGWDRAARRGNRPRVLNLSRFLIVPGVRVPHLASHVLAQAARRVAGDVERRYGVRPVLLESFVEVPRFRGTCYRAANWRCVGVTAGRGREDRRSYRERREVPAPLARKTIWLYPLTPTWREQLCIAAPTAGASR